MPRVIIRTALWNALLSIVCFQYIYFLTVNRVEKKYSRSQPIPARLIFAFVEYFAYLHLRF